MKPFPRRFLLSSAAFGIWLSTPAVRADYRSSVLGDAPAAYWRLNEEKLNQVCTNYGSAGAALNAYYNLGKFIPRAGAIAGDPDPCVPFDGAMSRVEVPYTPALNPNGAFSVEFWAMRTSSAANTYYAPVWSRGNGGTANGFLFYINNNNYWTFWVGATNSSSAYWMHPDSKTTAVNNTWYHVVGTYGPGIGSEGDTNWYAKLYINGVFQSRVLVNSNNNALAYQPNCGSTTATPYLSPFRIGAGGYAMTSQVPWPGYVDEVAFYTNALSDLQVSNHWTTATNVARTVSYFATITNDAPLAYWRLNETNTAIAYNQAGATAGVAANGIYEGSPVIPSSVDPATGIAINPSGYPGSFESATPGALSGSGDNDPAINFMPFTVGSSTGAKVEVPFNANLNTKTFSVECWANLQSLGTWNSLISSRTVVTGANGGYDVLINNTGILQFWIGGGGSASVKLLANTTFPLSSWNHVVAVYDGAFMSLYLNGEAVGAMQMYPPYLPNLANPMRLAAGATEGVQGNFYINGKLDEVAYYGYPLSPAQIATHYATGLGTTPAAATAPSFAVQPPGSTTLETGGAVALTGIAIGSVPMHYQWFKDGVLLAGQTSNTLLLSNVAVAATGFYELWATNGAGSSGTQASVQVNPPAAPTLSRDLPATTPFYAGAKVRLNVSVGGSLPLSFYWTSNGVMVAKTTNPELFLNNLPTTASGIRYGVVISNSVGTVASAGTALQVLSVEAGDYVARALGQNPVSYWRLGDSSPSTVAVDCWGGNHGEYVGAGQHFLPGALAVNDDGCVQLPGSSSVQMPVSAPFGNFSTTNRFTLMAWVKADGVSGIQRVFSTRQASPYVSGFGFGLSGTNLIFTGFGVADLTFASSITAGKWYHAAAVYSNKTVTCYLNGNVVGTANSVLNSLLPSSSPLYLGGNPTGSEWFVGTIDEAAVYDSALSAAQIITVFGSKPSITVAPVPASVVAGSVARFSIQGSGQSPLRYQWRTNGVAMASQTNTALALPRVPQVWNGLQITCLITNALGAITSAPVTLNVTAVNGYLGSVLADAPVAYWRLNESGGPTVFDFVDTHDGTATGSGFTYQDQSVGTALSAGGDSDPGVAFNGNGAFVVPYYSELNQGVFSIECWAYASGAATTFAAPLSSRLTSGAGFNFYSGVEGNFLGYTWQLWTGEKPWLYSVGPGINNYTWTHLVGTYDGSNVVLYVNGTPVVTNLSVLVTNSLSPLSIGGIASGHPYSLGAYFYGGVDEVAYYGYALSPYQAMGHYLLAGFGTNQAPQITLDPASQAEYVGLPCSLAAAAQGSIPLRYQWYKNGAPVAGGGGISFCATNLFALNLFQVQATDAGQYQLWVTNSLGHVGSATATLTVIDRPRLNVSNAWSSGGGLQLTFSGVAGQTYRIWTSPDVTLTPVETTWTLLASGTFTGTAETFTDTLAQKSDPTRFYIMTMP